MAVDWLAIKNDYINGLGSYRKLAEQYGVSRSTLEKRAKAEEWAKKRDEQCGKVEAEVGQKTAELIVQKEVDRVTRLLSISDRFVDRIEQAIRELDQTQVTHKTKTRVIEYKDKRADGKPTKETVQEEEQVIAVASIVDRKGLQQVAAALKTAWDITGESEANKPEDVEDDGLMSALEKIAGNIFDDGDDSAMLPKEKEE